MEVMGKVKTRFAPSPTGALHIGGVRTALYAYLLARGSNGIFALRIEDTDQERLVPGSAEDIIETLKWLGLEFDEGPIYQSKRLKIYQKYAQELIDKGLAYKKDGAIWFKTVKDGETSWTDLAGNKTITIANSLHDDFVMIKSDGYPTYNFAVVIDDHLMEITHIIRGVEFISSTPKHIMLFNAFSWQLPQFVHLPLILGSDRSKLSKRHGAQAASEFRKDGFLPEAILNFIVLLGWTSPSGREIMTLPEMIDEFSSKDLNLANPIFDMTKLEWMNGEYIRKTQISELKSQIFQYTRELSSGVLTPKDHPTEEEIEKIVPLIRERIKKLSDFIPLTDFIFEKPEYDIKIFQKININSDLLEQKKILEKILEILENFKKPWQAKVFEAAFRKLAQDENIKAGDMFLLIRVAVSGQAVTPPLFESIKIIGEDEVLDRIRGVVNTYPNF